MVKLEIILILTLLKISLFHSQDIIIVKAKENGYDLTDPEDHFFHDICLQFRFIKKDITLDYRRQYYFFPLNKNNQMNSKLISQRPIRNNSNDCIFSNNTSFSNLFSNLVFLCFFPIFLIQFFLIINALFLKLKDATTNTPLKKRMKNKNYKKEKEKEKRIKNDNKIAFSKFTPEMNNYQFSETLQKINDENEITDVIISNKKQNSSNNDINDININKQNINNDKNKKEKEEKSNDENSEPAPAKEKSADNYTFGIQFGKGYKFTNNGSLKGSTKSENSNDIKKENNDEKKDNFEKKGDKMKRIQYVYEQMNQNKRKTNIINKVNKNNNINSDTPIIFNNKKNMEKFYVREEYFYFGYLLARIEDKRTVLQIYLDLLEQCQIFFKFLHTPFNIYEDRKIQIVYYLTKINIYFLINCQLIKSSVINDVYDGKNKFINDFIRSIFATFITYGIGLIFYYLTNVKKQLIKRRYKILNMAIIDARLNNEIIKFTMNFCLNFLFNKLLLLSIVFMIIFLYSSYVCFSFCSVYYFNQFLLLKCVLLSISISLITPIFACWLPALLRKISLQKKKGTLYDLTKNIELLFIPW